jgi:hypothetical protein
VIAPSGDLKLKDRDHLINVSSVRSLVTDSVDSLLPDSQITRLPDHPMTRFL